MEESFVIQSNTSNLPYVEERLFHFCNVCNVGNCYATISVAALQAVENAIVHGNHSDPNLKVELRMGTCKGGVYVTVKDEGEGFDYLRYGRLPGDSEKGEGIFVMQTLADKMTYSGGGRTVRLEFGVNGIDPADTLERISVLQSFYAMVAA